MGNAAMDTKIFDEACIFAVNAHAGTERRGKKLPYAVHVLEAAEIVSTITTDQELIAAALLHDTIEDTDVTAEEIAEKFGKRIADLVVSESDVMPEGISEAESWHMRKQAAIDRLAGASRDAKIVAMGDKLSNMRAIARDYDAIGDELWNRFHVTDPNEHAWHYRGLRDSLSELSDTEAYQEFSNLVDSVFNRACTEFNFGIDTEKNRVYVAGALNGENTTKMLDSLDGDKEYVLDFSGVSDINFAGLRAFIRAHADGKKLNIANASDAVYDKFNSSAVSSYVRITKAPVCLNMDEWELTGDGYTAESFFDKSGDAMMKLYFDFVDEGMIEQEKRVASSVMLMGVNTPMVGDIVCNGKRKGVAFERVVGKVSIARALSNNPERCEELAERYAKMCLDLHSRPCDKTMFPSMAALTREAVDKAAEYFTDEQRQKMYDFLDTIPETGTCIHGDLHMGNVIITENDTLWIDMADFAYGNPLLDIATTYYSCNFMWDELAMKIFHCTSAQLKEFWKYFAKYYFGADTEEKLAQVNHMMTPYAGLRELFLGLRDNMEGMKPDIIEHICNWKA